jgi:hypothetical protein
MTLCSVAMPPKCSFFFSLLNVTIDCRNSVKFLPGYQFRFAIFVAWYPVVPMISTGSALWRACRHLNYDLHARLARPTLLPSGWRKTPFLNDTFVAHSDTGPVSFQLQYPRFRAIDHPTSHSRKLWLMRWSQSVPAILCVILCKLEHTLMCYAVVFFTQ